MTEENQNQSAIDAGCNRKNGGGETAGDTVKNAVEDFGKAALDRISNAIKDVTAR